MKEFKIPQKHQPLLQLPIGRHQRLAQVEGHRASAANTCFAANTPRMQNKALRRRLTRQARIKVIHVRMSFTAQKRHWKGQQHAAHVMVEVEEFQSATKKGADREPVCEQTRIKPLPLSNTNSAMRNFLGAYLIVIPKCRPASGSSNTFSRSSE